MTKLRKPVVTVKLDFGKVEEVRLWTKVEPFTEYVRAEALDLHNNWICEPLEYGSWAYNVRPVKDLSFRKALRLLRWEITEGEPWLLWYRVGATDD